MVNIVSDDATYIPRALINTFMKFIVRCFERKSSRRGSYFIALRLLFNSIFVSNPTINNNKLSIFSWLTMIVDIAI